MVLHHFHPERWLETDELVMGKVSLHELRRTLARMARVSSTFSGPALCALWSVIDDFEPLLRLLACRRMVAVESDDSGSEDEESRPAPELEIDFLDTRQVLEGDISPSDWERFQYYAALVRVCLYDYDPTIDSSVYMQLSLRNGNKPLLPNLRYLKWQQQSCNGSELLYIIGPSVRRLEFDYASKAWRSGRARRRDYALKALLDSASSRAPNHVYVHHVVEFAALKMLSSLESLTSLRMDISHLRDTEETCDGFGRLESLTVEGDESTSSGAEVTTEGCRRRLENLQIHVKYPRLGSLTLRIAFKGEDIPTVPEIIQPLFVMKDLEAFDFDFSSAAHLSDTDVEEIIRHWTNLRSLQLDHIFTAIEPTVHSLDIIARGCPHLQELVLPSVCHESYIPEKPYAPPHHNLRRIIFYRAMISDRARFTKYMFQIFPDVVPSLPSLFYRRPCEDWCLIVDSFRPVHPI
ncbi:uncharacterized protein B0H18DRAFT_1118059 [Fomitopsis serialis]|uniref:uncharacterized protein n=1 Tax=Fomitopsis serialis TaxID=139415 RepID=UPI002007E7F3|nr:uncharacterized protein B0H18DRAFT_1118059 [Neoantrodia serialis]KAH9928386.1 hypothetical protein B0H18DRAFT_1118059 [Neoantrodia serialis]